MIALAVFGLSLPLVALCLAVAYVGSAVQSSLGIGLGILGAPVLALIDPAFVPAVIIIWVLPLSVGVAIADRHHVESGRIGTALLGRVPGVLVGAYVVAQVSETILGVLVAATVLLGIVASVTTRRFRPTNATMLGAGFASGVTGTAVGIGGPPMALTYQHEDRATMRSSLSAFFSIGTTLSLVALIVAGEVGGREWQLAALAFPAVMLGWITSRAFQERFPARFVRPAVLGLSAFTAIAVLIRSIW